MENYKLITKKIKIIKEKDHQENSLLKKLEEIIFEKLKI
jgi:hypothetical protein